MGLIEDEYFNATDGLDVMPWQEFEQMEFPKVRWIVNNLVPAGSIVILAAPSGEKKSWLAWHMARCVATGINFLGNEEFSTYKSSVLYIEQETPLAEMQRRGRQLGVSEASEGIWILRRGNEINLNNDHAVKWLHDVVVAHDIKVIFVDTLRSAAGGLQEDKGEDVRKFFARFKPWNDEGRTLVFLIREQTADSIQWHNLILTYWITQPTTFYH